MEIAVDPQSPNGNLVSVADWHRTRRNQTATCIICGQPVKRRPEHGQGTLHFFHNPGTNCPSTAPAATRYNPLSKLPRDPSISSENKAYVFDNLIGIHDRMRKFLGTIRLSDILRMCEAGTARDVWSLKGMPKEMLPYVLLTCMDEFPPLGQRLHPIYFVIQAPPLRSFYWNFPAGHSRYILEVNATNPAKFKTVAMDLSPPVSQVVEQLRKMLT